MLGTLVSLAFISHKTWNKAGRIEWLCRARFGIFDSSGSDCSVTDIMWLRISVMSTGLSEFGRGRFFCGLQTSVGNF